MLRLPRGVTVSASKNSFQQQTLQLWDVENCVQCASVRERITELDWNVLIIPAASNSRSMNDVTYEYAHPSLFNKDTKPEVPFLLATNKADDDTVVRVSGTKNILAFFETVEAGSSNDKNEETDIVKSLKTAGSYLASWMRIGRGTTVSSCVSMQDRPTKPPILYSYEGNQFCRLVREVLLELDIVYELRSAGKESPRRAELASITGGSTQCPFLMDGEVSMSESKDIVQYLYQNYARWTPPNELLEWTSNNVMGLLKPVFAILAPLQAGSGDEKNGDYAQKLQEAIRDIKMETTADKVVVYTYELSPFSSETRALLDSLNVDYKEISLGKEWIPGLISPKGSIKRAALLEMTGQSSLPHIFIGGKAIGGLFSGNPGLLPGLEQGVLVDLLRKAQRAKSKSSA
jgi:anaphase-promoting complex subunit 7